MSETAATSLVVVISDIHVPHQHRPTWRAFRQWHTDHRPDLLVVLGDFFDLNEMKSFAPEVGERTSVLPGLAEGVAELNALASEAGRTVFVEGNHEHRWYRRVIEPIALQCGGLVGLNLGDQCKAQGLDPNIEWRAESRAWRGLEVGQFLLRHGHRQSGRFGGGIHVARNALIKSMGRSQIFGHHHVIQMACHGTPRGACVAIANGHMEAEVEFALETPWSRGFTVLELDNETNRATPYPVLIEDGRFVWRGRVYDGAREHSVGAMSVAAPRRRRGRRPVASDVNATRYAQHDGTPSIREMMAAIVAAGHIPRHILNPKASITFRGETRGYREWALIAGIRWQTLHRRIARGWTVDRALTHGTRLGMPGTEVPCTDT